MKCPDCGADNLEGAAYCEDCGSKLPVAAAVAPPPAAEVSAPPPQEIAAAAPTIDGGMIRCAACGAENPSTEAYCEDCGASLTATPSVATPVQEVSSPVSTPVSAAVAKLIVTTSGREFPLNKDVVTIGRRSPADGIYPDVDLTDDDPESYISRRHGQVIKQSSEFIFEDVGSSNGSFVNNVRANKGEQYPLKNNDQVRLGKTEMVFKGAE